MRKCSNDSNEAAAGETLCGKCRSVQRNRHRERYATDPEYRQRLNENAKQWAKDNPEKVRAAARRHSQKRSQERLRWRRLALEVYGGSCACCGQDEWQFLTLDHANGDGAAHREMLMGRRRQVTPGEFVMALGKQGFPSYPGLRVMCFNCHMAEDLFGGCPHKAIIAGTADSPVESLR